LAERHLFPLLAAVALAVGKETLAGRGGTPLRFIENAAIGLVSAWLVGFLWNSLSNSRFGKSRLPGRAVMEAQFFLTLLIFSTNIVSANGEGVLHVFDQTLHDNIDLFRRYVWLLDFVRVLFCSLLALAALHLLVVALPKEWLQSFGDSDFQLARSLAAGFWMLAIGSPVAYIALYLI
jgi:hypothetical protein